MMSADSLTAPFRLDARMYYNYYLVAVSDSGMPKFRDAARGSVSVRC